MIPSSRLAAALTFILTGLSLCQGLMAPATDHQPVATHWRSATLAGTGSKGTAPHSSPARQAALNNPFGLARSPDGSLYFCDTDNHCIRRITPTGIIETVAGTGQRGYAGDGGPATQALLNEPYEIRFDPQGNWVFVEMRNHVVRRVDRTSYIITTLAGTGVEGFSGDGGPATKATFKQPHSIQFGPDQRLYICDIGNHRIRVIDPLTGIISTFAGTGEKRPTPEGANRNGTPLNGPRAIDFDRQGNLWLALREGNQIVRLDAHDQRFHIIAGTGKQGFSGHGGPASAATLSGPKGISIDPTSGNVFFADTESHTIRAIDIKTLQILWVAGTGSRHDGPDGPALQTGLARPHGIFVEQDGSVLVGDSENHRIRVLSPLASPK